MLKKSTKESSGTSYFGSNIITTVNDLIQLFGAPYSEDNSGEDKVNFEWELEDEDGKFITIYDWKEYRKLRLNEKIIFHIGGENEFITRKAQSELIQLL